MPDYQLPDHLGGGTITIRLHGNDDDTKRRFNRTENIRPIPQTDPDFKALYRRRNDAESINLRSTTRCGSGERTRSARAPAPQPPDPRPRREQPRHPAPPAPEPPTAATRRLTIVDPTGSAASARLRPGSEPTRAGSGQRTAPSEPAAASTIEPRRRRSRAREFSPAFSTGPALVGPVENPARPGHEFGCRRLGTDSLCFGTDKRQRVPCHHNRRVAHKSVSLGPSNHTDLHHGGPPQHRVSNLGTHALVDPSTDPTSGPVNGQEAVRDLYTMWGDKARATRMLGLLIDYCATSAASEIRGLARTPKQWRHAIVAWHETGHSNGPVEGLKSLIKKIKRVAAGFRNFTHYRLRILLACGRCNWALLGTPPR